MSCDETRPLLSSYLDDGLAVAAREACDEHLHECPLCRAELADLRSLSRSLSGLARPQPPADLAASISVRLGIEVAAQQRAPRLPLGERLARWVRPRLMPYTVGSLASLLLFFIMFNALRPHLRALQEAAEAHTEAEQASLKVIYLSEEASSYPDITKPVPPDVYAAGRAPFAIESPSLNPSGALAALTLGRTHGHRNDTDDDMVVVTDVFSNGSASLAGVVQAPRDPRMLDEFQSALRKDAAFVPASFDRRPETMRVVFVVVQKINVKDAPSQKF